MISSREISEMALNARCSSMILMKALTNKKCGSRQGSIINTVVGYNTAACALSP